MEATQCGVRKFSRDPKPVTYPQSFLNDVALQWTRVMDGYTPRPALLDEITRNMSPATAAGWPSFDTKLGAYKKHGVKEVYERALLGEYSPGVWSVCAKSEVLDAEKRSGGERNFVSGHFPGYISYMTWAKPMADYMHDNWSKLPSKVGSSKFLGELASIFQSMKSPYPVLSLDVKGMEFDFPEQMHRAIQKFREALCPQFDWQAAYDDLIKAHIKCPCCGRVLQKNFGNCSGHGGTIDDNGLAGTFTMYIAYMVYTNMETDPHAFMRENKFAIVGDDILYSGPMDFNLLYEVFFDCGFELKLEKRTPTCEGAVFLSHEYRGGRVFSTHPEKLLARLLYYKYNRSEMSNVLIGFDIELMYCKRERQIVRRFGDWYAKTFRTPIRWMSDHDIEKLYNGY